MPRCVLFFLLYVPSAILYVGASTLLLHLDTLTNCDGSQNATITIQKQAIKVANDKQYVDLNLVALEDIPLKPTAIVTIQKCNNKESPDTCIQFAPIRTSKCCEIMNDAMYGFSSFLQCLRPTLSCPVRKNTYRARHCVFDFSGFQMFPLQGSYWKVKGQIIYKGNELGCAVAAGVLLSK